MIIICISSILPPDGVSAVGGWGLSVCLLCKMRGGACTGYHSANTNSFTLIHTHIYAYRPLADSSLPDLHVFDLGKEPGTPGDKPTQTRRGSSCEVMVLNTANRHSWRSQCMVRLKLITDKRI